MSKRSWKARAISANAIQAGDLSENFEDLLYVKCETIGARSRGLYEGSENGLSSLRYLWKDESDLRSNVVLYFFWLWSTIQDKLESRSKSTIFEESLSSCGGAKSFWALA